MAYSCSGCGYAYEESAIQAGLPDERCCPVCRSNNVAVKVMLPTLTVITAALPVGILITANLWSAWLNIAIERAIEARRIRAEMLLVPDNGGEIAGLLGDEFQASIVAVAASAHALDALYGSAAIPQSVRDQRRTFGKGSRRGNIQEALKTVFDVGAVMTGWVPEFEWLFDLRDAAAHSLEVAETPVPHPTGTNTSPVQVNYSVESAERAVSFALSVLHWCVNHPRRRDALAVKWSAEMRPVVEGLEQRWRQGGHTEK